jgi:hypothetical protein
MAIEDIRGVEQIPAELILKRLVRRFFDTEESLQPGVCTTDPASPNFSLRYSVSSCFSATLISQESRFAS